MGFLSIGEEPTKRARSIKQQPSVEILHRQECRACPLANQHGLKHPNMQPHGSEEPLLYFLGEAPGKTEDLKGIPFVGVAGQALRLRLPAWATDEVVRWNNCVRTRPPGNRTPVWNEIEACRPSIIRDIEATKPRAIFGFGNVPLHWAIGQTGITKWNGRQIPIKVGSHTCWFFPMLHPSYVARSRKFDPRNADEYGSEIEFVFACDLRNALDCILDLPEPIIHTAEEARSGIEWVDGSRGNDDVRWVQDVLNYCASFSLVGFDYETNGLRPYAKGAKIMTVGLSTRDGSFAFPLDHPEAGWSPPQLEKIRSAFEEFLYQASCNKAVHHLAFEMEWSAFFYGGEVLRAGRWSDTVGQAYILDERLGRGRPGCHSLEFLCLQYFGLNVKALSPVDRTKIEQQPLSTVLPYNALDAKYHRLLYSVQARRLKEEGLYEVYRQHLRRVPTMVLSQLKGFPINQERAKAFQTKYTEARSAVEVKLNALSVVQKFENTTGNAFRPSANADLKTALRILGHDPEHVDEKALKEIDHPLCSLIIEWRKANKLLSTYVEPVLEGSPHIWPDGLAHPITTTSKTRTWRTSAEDFNYQNWPKRNQDAKEIRSMVSAKPGWKVVSFDYGQIQARNVAMESRDRALVKAFWDRYDIHHAWTERMGQIYPQWFKEGGGVKVVAGDHKLWKSHRDRIKNEFVFPSFFGAQAKSVSGYLGVPLKIGEELHDEFWTQFPDIKGWHERLEKEYYRTGYVTGLTGFRRRAPVSINELINAPIQADESMIVCDAMARLSELEESQYQASLMIHDDLTFFWPTKKVEEYAEVVIREMLHTPFEWARIVPLVVEMSVGDDWAHKEDVGVYASDTWEGGLGIDDTKREEVGIGSWDDGTGWANAKRYEKPSPKKKRYA